MNMQNMLAKIFGRVSFPVSVCCPHSSDQSVAPAGWMPVNDACEECCHLINLFKNGPIVINSGHCME